MKILNADISSTKLSEKVATCIANGIIQSQNWFTIKMQGLTKNWQQKQRWIFLYIVCLVFSGASIIAMINPFKSTGINKIIMPKPINKTAISNKQYRGFLITKDELQKVQQYKSTHPNLSKEMPALYDSLNLIEQVYYSQQK